MSEGPRYHLRRGRMPKLVDQVAAERPRAYGTVDQIPRIAAGSVADLKPPPLDLGDIEPPTVARTATTFGAVELVIEHHGDRVELVLPGLTRIQGTAAEAARLAALLTKRS